LVPCGRLSSIKLKVGESITGSLKRRTRKVSSK